MIVTQVLQRITSALDQSGIGHMVVGSFASAYHGVPRSTQDIDVVIDATPATLRTFIAALPSDQYYVEVNAALDAYERQSMFNVIDLTAGWKIDLIIRKSRAFSQEEFRRRQRANLHGVTLFVASAEDVVISKLEWAKLGHSGRQIEDVAALLRARWHTLDVSYLEKWLDELGLEQEWREAKSTAGISD